MARKLFFHMVFRKFIENTNKKQILVSTMFFTNINISFFFLICVVISFQSLPKKVNQIRNNVVSVLTRLNFVFWFALTVGCCNAFQHIFVNQKKSSFRAHISRLCCLLWLWFIYQLMKNNLKSNHLIKNYIKN